MKYALLAACLLWLWWRNYESPHRCDAGNLSPTEEACPHGVRDADNCLMCAIEEPDDQTPLTKSILRNEWVNSVEQWLEVQKGKK
jgi:hypothetical protein